MKTQTKLIDHCQHSNGTKRRGSQWIFSLERQGVVEVLLVMDTLCKRGEPICKASPHFGRQGQPFLPTLDYRNTHAT